MNVFDWDKTDLDNLKLKLSYMTSKNKIILSPVKYQKQNFICQTPTALILNKLPLDNISGKNFYKIALLFEYYKFNKKTLEFIDKITEIEAFLINKYSKPRFNGSYLS